MLAFSISLIVIGLLSVLSMYTIFSKSNNEGLVLLFVGGISLVIGGSILVISELVFRGLF